MRGAGALARMILFPLLLSLMLPQAALAAGRARPPEADFEADATLGVAPLEVRFSDLSSGEVEEWLWDFGDGTTSTERNPVHIYRDPGLYTVSLTISGPAGRDTEVKENYIYVGSSGGRAFGKIYPQGRPLQEGVEGEIGFDIDGDGELDYKRPVEIDPRWRVRFGDIPPRLEIPGAPPVPPTLVVRKPGYLPVRIPVEVIPGQLLRLPPVLFRGGDADGNGIVNRSDLLLIRKSLWKRPFEIDPRADANNDGKVDIYDVVLAGANFGLTESAVAAPAPDLVISQIICDRTNRKLGYVVANIGSDRAPAGHKTALYVNGSEVCEDEVVVPLDPGEVYEGWFECYEWPACQEIEVEVSADVHDAISELDEDNNSLKKPCTCPAPEESMLAWAAGPEGVLLRWFPRGGGCPCSQPQFYKVFRDGTLIAEVRRITDEAEALGILGESFDELKSFFASLGVEIESVADLHDALDQRPFLEARLSDLNYRLALVRGTGYLDENVVLGETYTYRVKAVLPGGAEEDVGEVTIEYTGATPLSPPTGLELAAVLDTRPELSFDWAKSQKNRRAHRRVFLRWDLPASEPDCWIAGYDVFRAESYWGPYEQINEIPVLPMPACVPEGIPEGADYELVGFFFVDADPELECGKTYYYRIAPRDLLGHEGPMSAPIRAVPPDTIPPPPPANLQAVPDHSAGVIKLTWDPVEDQDPEGGSVIYHIFRSAAPDAGWPGLADCASRPCWNEVAVVSTNSWTDTTAAYEKPYWYTVRAEDQAGNMSAPSSLAGAVLHDRTPPGKPAVDVERTGIRICVDPDTVRILIFCSVDGSPLLFLGEEKPSALCFDIDPEDLIKPPFPVKAVWRFAAVDEHGNCSDLSDPVEVVVGPPEAPLPPPIIEDIKTLEGGAYGWTAEISWKAAPAPGLSGFRIYRKIYPAGSEELIADESILGPDARSFKDEEVDPSFIYSYRVVAYRKAGPFGPELEISSAPKLYKVSPPLACCTRPLNEIKWDPSSKFIPGTGTELKWTLEADPHLLEILRPWYVVFRSLKESEGYVQLTPPLTCDHYLDRSARHDEYWYVVLALHPNTGEIIGASEPWSPASSSPSIPGPSISTSSAPEALAAGSASSSQFAVGEIEELVIEASADALLDSSYPTANFGKGYAIGVGYGKIPPSAQRSLLRFDLSAIPEGAVLVEAQLRLYLSQATGAATVDVGVYNVTSEWEEDEVTWQTAPSTGELFAQAKVGTSIGWYTWDVTELVGKWLAGILPNYGLEIAGAAAGASFTRVFNSREARGPRPELVVRYTFLPEVLVFGTQGGEEFRVTVESYEVGSTLDSMSGEGILELGGGAVPITTCEVEFHDVAAEEDGTVLSGEASAILPSPIEVDWPGGFHYEIAQLSVDEERGWGEINLFLPSGITAWSGGAPQEPLELHDVRIHSDLSFETELDVTALPDQSCAAPVPSFYFELDPLPLRVVPRAPVLFTQEEISFDDACTQYEDRLTGPACIAPIQASNDGYLKVVYQSKGPVVIRKEGLWGDFMTADLINYTTAFPFGFHITAQGAEIKIKESKIVGGELKKASLEFDYYQTTDFFAMPTGKFAGAFAKNPKIGKGGSILGRVHTSSVIEWGGGGFKLYDTEYDVYIAPVQTSDLPQKDAWADCEIDPRIQPGLNRVTEPGESASFAWLNCGTGAPVAFPEVRADLYVRRGGVSDIIEAEIPLGSDVPTSLYGYETHMTSFRLSFCDNYIFDSDVAGELILPFPADMVIPLIKMKLDPNTACAEGGMVRSDADPLVPAFWRIDIHPEAVEFRPDPSLPPPGEPEWTRALWILGTVDIPHLSPPEGAGTASVPLETSFAPDGTFYAFDLIYDGVYYGFDGFPFLLEEARLSAWDPSSPEAPGWDPDATLEEPPECCEDYGFVELRGSLIVPYFGTILAEGADEPPLLYVLGWDDYVGFSAVPRVERAWTAITDITWSFDLLYAACGQSEERGIFVGFRHDEIPPYASVIEMDQGVVIEADDEVSTNLFLGLSSGIGVLRALAQASFETLPENFEDIRGQVEQWRARFPEMDEDYVDFLGDLWEKFENRDYTEATEVIDELEEEEIPEDPSGGGTEGLLEDWGVKLEKMRGTVAFEPVYSGGEIVDWEIEALRITLNFEIKTSEMVQALVEAERLTFEITRDGDYNLIGEGIKSSLFGRDLEADFAVSINTSGPKVEGGITLHDLRVDCVYFYNVGAALGVGEEDGEFIMYLGALADAEYISPYGTGTAGGAILLGIINPESVVLRSLGYGDLLDNLGETGAAGTLTGAYLRVYGDFPLIDQGCTLKANVGARIALWYFATEVGDAAYGGEIAGYAYGEVLCVVDARGDLSLSIYHAGGSYYLVGEFWIAGGIGWCEPETWTSWDERWWDDDWCRTCGAIFHVDYNSAAGDWSWDWDAECE